jgi:hypothetical protein
MSPCVTSSPHPWFDRRLEQLGYHAAMVRSESMDLQPVSEDRRPSRGWSTAVFMVALVVFVLSPVRQVSDASYSLLVSESLLQHGTFALDAYVETPLDPAVHPASSDGGLPYHLVKSGGHIYYAYPPGTSILSVPFVALSHLFGMSAVHPDGGYHYREERRMQLRLAALLMAILALVVYRMAALLLSQRRALFFTAASVLTTQVWSTASRGLWSHTWAILLVVTAILFLVRHETGVGRLRPVLLASLMCWAYFTRPTMAIGVAAIGLYLVLRFRKALVPYVATVSGWLAIFVATSWLQYGSFLPPYYRPTMLGTTEFLTGLTANLISPSRGLLIFLPHLLVIAYFLIRYRRWSPLMPLAILGAAVTLGHLLVVASFSIWWGGEGYGPRLMADAVPWLIVIALAAVQGWGMARSKNPARITRFQLEAALLVVLSLAALGLNGVGAWSAATNEWNWTPVSVDQEPARVWDWGDAQFLAPWRDGSD